MVNAFCDHRTHGLLQLLGDTGCSPLSFLENVSVLLRVDMPGLQFDALELRFEACTATRAAQLSYRPDSLDDLLAWNEIETAPDSAALYELLIACYAQWLSEDGWRNPAMESAMAAETPVQMVRLAPRHLSLFTRFQHWLGLQDITSENRDVCETA
jgi:hypothetical protein